MQWLRDGLDTIRDAGDTPALAEAADPLHTPCLVPVFTGLGVPWWYAECRGAIHGLTRASGQAELVRAALESLAYQVRDLLGAMLDDQTSAGDSPVVRVDGGMSANDIAMQFLADILAMPVDRMANVGAAGHGQFRQLLAGRQTFHTGHGARRGRQALPGIAGRGAAHTRGEAGSNGMIGEDTGTRLDAAGETGFDEQVRFTGDLVRLPSLRGREATAQNFIARALATRGFAVDRWQIRNKHIHDLPGLDG